MASFKRRVNDKLIEKLKEEPLWKEKLSDDCRKGDVFLAIRDNRIQFYHKGGSLFSYDKNGFSTHKKYAAVINQKGDYITESTLKNDADLIKSFIAGYEKIKGNCKTYALHSEAAGVSSLYHKYSYLSKKNIVVLDIEIEFSSLTEGKIYDRCDVLLYNRETHQLRFVEAKLFDNSEIRAEDHKPSVLDQISRYKRQIRDRPEILPVYQEYAQNLDKIFDHDLNITPMNIDPRVCLLVFDFDESQRTTRLREHVTANSHFKNVPHYESGSTSINAESLWKETNKP
jgi:hypothetical protein